MKLFLVCYDDANGENFDQFIRTTDSKTAIEMWRRNLEVQFERDMDGEEPDRVWEINDTTVGVLPWHSREGAVEVTGAFEDDQAA